MIRSRYESVAMMISPVPWIASVSTSNAATLYGVLTAGKRSIYVLRITEVDSRSAPYRYGERLRMCGSRTPGMPSAFAIAIFWLARVLSKRLSLSSSSHSFFP